MEITARKKKCYLTEIEEKKYKKKKTKKKSWHMSKRKFNDMFNEDENCSRV